jgi:hypothetical protein
VSGKNVTRVLRPTREEVTGEFKTLHDEGIHNSYEHCSSDFIWKDRFEGNEMGGTYNMHRQYNKMHREHEM